jgi:polysaccharide biosynthesis/export protein
MKLKVPLIAIIIALAFTSCSTTQKVVYLQDIAQKPTQKITENDIVAQDKDNISIIVSSKDPQLAAMFNLPRISSYAGSSTGSTSGSTISTNLFQMNGDIASYTVDDDGSIDFPVLGKMHVEGLTKYQISSMIKDKLVKSNLILDPVVTVDFLNLHISILGEVAHPGQISIDRDKINLLEALSKAGDLTIYGRRDSILVIREENGQRTTYSVDLRTKKLFDSPVYNLKQNDIVYVKPNSTRAGQSTVNDNNVKSVSLWLSIASFLTTLGVLIFK